MVSWQQHEKLIIPQNNQAVDDEQALDETGFDNALGSHHNSN